MASDDHHDLPASVRFMCSFGGKILPRPHDNQLRYVGGDTRIVSLPRRPISFSSLLVKLSRLTGKSQSDDLTIKYQLPNEDLDALITLASDEDLENMMEEHDRNPSSRLRLFLFSNDSISRTSSISSLLDGSTKRESWFLDALNGRPGLERGRSEVSSIVSEVPDYLFGLDNSDDQPKSKTRLNTVDTVSINSDPGSPNPVMPSPFCSTSSSLAPPIQDLPSVKVNPSVSGPKMENPNVENFIHQQPDHQSMWHYVPEAQYPPQSLQHIPVYYVPGPVQQGNVPNAPYIQSFPQPLPGQLPMGYNQTTSGMGQIYGVGPRPVTMVDQHGMPSRVISENMNQQQVFYRNPYTGMVMQGGDDMAVMGSEPKLDRVNQPR